MKQTNASRMTTLRRLLSYLKRYLPGFAAAIVLSVASVVLMLYIPILCGRAIDDMIGEGMVDFTRLTDCLTRIAVCAALYSILQWIMNTVSNRITYSVIRDVRADAFDTLTHLPLSYVDSHPHGDTVSRIISDVDAFADGLLLGFTQLFTGVATILATLVFMVTIEPFIALLVVILTPLSLLTASFIARRTYAMFRLQSETRAEMTAQIDEVIGGQPLVRAFSMEDDKITQFDEIAGRLEKASLRAIFFSSLTNPTTRFINNLVYAAVCLAGALAAVSGSMTVGGLTSFLAYANQYTRPFNEISGVVTELQHALASAERIFALIDEVRETPDDGAAVLDAVNGAVELRNVDFSYDPDKQLIRDFNLTVHPGERIAIVGPTGCGKTTLINLLMRFYDVNAGRITVDGHDIRTVTRDSLHRSYGMVLQDTWLMHGTVRDNIKMGREASDEAVRAAALAAHADGFIRRLPQGYDTVIDDDGGQLSAGERQLLCIARVMLEIPPMLILDEATSSIDTRTEQKIQEAFASLMRGRTSFIVAHRLTTTREADNILVMKDGAIIETGRHEELLEKQGFYSSLWNS